MMVVAMLLVLTGQAGWNKLTQLVDYRHPQWRLVRCCTKVLVMGEYHCCWGDLSDCLLECNACKVTICRSALVCLCFD
jgi:hypothetical protein